MYYVMLYARDKSDEHDTWVEFLRTEDIGDALEKYADFVRSYGNCDTRLLEEVKTEISVDVEVV